MINEVLSGFLVNPCLNPDLEIDALVTGDPVDAFWHGVEIGKKVYTSPFPNKPDIAVFNAWPKDAEFTQAGMAMVPLRGGNADKLKDDTTVVLSTASPPPLLFAESLLIVIVDPQKISIP